MTHNSIELPEFIDTEEGSSLYYNNKWLYSRHKPVSRAIALVAALPIQEECLYIIYSPCLWYGIPELLARLPASSAVLALEYDPVLCTVAHNFMPQSIIDAIEHKKLAFVDRASVSKLFFIVSQLGRFRRVQEVLFSSGWTLEPDWYKSFPQKLLQHFSYYYRSRLTLNRMGWLWIRNTLKNILSLPAVPAPVPQTSLPVLVCGAGLSLVKTLPFIKEARNNIFILACDTAFGTLRDAGITPDSIVCLDAQLYNTGDLIGYNETGTIPHAFLDISAHPSFYKNIFTSCTPVVTLWAQTKLLPRLLSLPYNFITLSPHGSVGITALDLAMKIAQKEILITGLDFAFTSGWTHAPGTHIDRYELAHENRLYKRKTSWSMSFREGTTAFGNTLRTDPSLLMYHDSCKALLEEYQTMATILDLRGNLGLELGCVSIELHEISSRVVTNGNNPGAHCPCSEYNQANTYSINAQTPLSAAKTQNTSCDISIVKNFLKQEYHAIQELRELLITGNDTDALTQKLLELDYLYIHFPDYERVTALELDFLKRVALACEYWLFYLEKICPQCKSS